MAKGCVVCKATDHLTVRNGKVMCWRHSEEAKVASFATDLSRSWKKSVR